MKQSHIDQVAHIFKLQTVGHRLNKEERAFLQGLLDNMNAAERAGSIASIIRIMIGEEK